MTLTLKWWDEILSTVKLNNSSEDGILEQIKAKLRKQDEGTYQEWEQKDFNINHLFTIGSDRIKVKSTLLHLAAESGHTGVGQALLDKGADVNVQDESGCTPLHLAAENGHTGVGQALLDKRADVNVQDESGRTPLYFAIRDGKLEFVRLLLDHNADINIKTSNNLAHLSWAINRNRVCKKGNAWKIVELLLEKKAKIGKEELEEAVRVGDLKVIGLLVNKGAVITQEIVQYANKVYEGCMKGKAYTRWYPGGLEGEKQARVQILGFLNGKFSNVQPQAVNGVGGERSQNSKLESQRPQENVDKGENIMNNEEASIEEAIGNDCEKGKMHSSNQDTKVIEEALSYAILSLDCEKVRSLVEQVKQEDNNVEQIISEAQKEANKTQVGKKDKTPKNKLEEIKRFLAKELESIAALSVSGNVENISATISSRETPVNEDELRLKNRDDSSLLSSSDKSARTSSGSNSGSPFEEINKESHETTEPVTKVVTSEMPLMATESDITVANKNIQPELVTNGQDSGAKDSSKSNPKENNAASQNTKMYGVAASALAIAGIISGVAIAVYLGMLAVGIAVGACCLIAAVIVYYCNKPSKSLENSNAQTVTPEDLKTSCCA